MFTMHHIMVQISQAGVEELDFLQEISFYLMYLLFAHLLNLYPSYSISASVKDNANPGLFIKMALCFKQSTC